MFSSFVLDSLACLVSVLPESDLTHVRYYHGGGGGAGGPGAAGGSGAAGGNGLQYATSGALQYYGGGGGGNWFVTNVLNVGPGGLGGRGWWICKHQRGAQHGRRWWCWRQRLLGRLGHCPFALLETGPY